MKKNKSLQNLWYLEKSRLQNGHLLFELTKKHLNTNT